MARRRNGIEEARLQIRQLRQKFQEDIANSMLETRQKINDLREKVRVAQDVLLLRHLRLDAPIEPDGRAGAEGETGNDERLLIDGISALADCGRSSNAYPSDHCGKGRECLPRSPPASEIAHLHGGDECKLSPNER
jgi:hypothetical protein